MTRVSQTMVWATIVCITISLVSAQTVQSGPLKTLHHGTIIVGIPKKLNTKYDVEVLPVDIGIKNIKEALNLIFSKSHFNALWIKHLLTHGKIIIIYDSSFPAPKLASQIIAGFFPDFYQHKGTLKQFSVVIGRYGIKWDPKNLAAVIVHELVGHGLQHLRGRTKFDRKIDRECEALIYEEKARQDLNVQRNPQKRARFLRDMRFKWCADFNYFLSRKKINTDEVWGFGRPNIIYLLKHFNVYIEHLRNTGVAKKAVTASKKKRLNDFKAFLIEAEHSNNSDNYFIIGKRYLMGIGIKKDYNKAYTWLQKASKMDHPSAQLYIGKIFENGLGVIANQKIAHKWFSRAAMNGSDRALKNKLRLQKLISSQN